MAHTAQAHRPATSDCVGTHTRVATTHIQVHPAERPNHKTLPPAGVDLGSMRQQRRCRGVKLLTLSVIVERYPGMTPGCKRHHMLVTTNTASADHSCLCSPSAAPCAAAFVAAAVPAAFFAVFFDAVVAAFAAFLAAACCCQCARYPGQYCSSNCLASTVTAQHAPDPVFGQQGAVNSRLLLLLQQPPQPLCHLLMGQAFCHDSSRSSSPLLHLLLPLLHPAAPSAPATAACLPGYTGAPPRCPG